MTPALWPLRYHPTPSTWMRCCLCGVAQRLRDMDEIGHGRWLCSEDTATPLCHRLRVEVGAARAEPVTNSASQPKEASK